MKRLFQASISVFTLFCYYINIDYVISKYFLQYQVIVSLMTLVTIKMVTLNQCRVIWNKITAVTAMPLVKKKKRVNLLEGMKRGSDIFKDSTSNLGI